MRKIISQQESEVSVEFKKFMPNSRLVWK